MNKSIKVCSVDGCERPSKSLSYCGSHYSQHLRKGVVTPITRKPNEYVTCSIEGCNRKHYGLGFCGAHHKRYVEGRPLDTPIKEYSHGRTCNVSGCDRPHVSKGHCELHRRRREEGYEMYAPLQIQRYGCKVPNCDRKHVARGFCGSHHKILINYNLSEERFIALLSSSCKICGSTVKLSIDHDHSCCNSQMSSCGKCVRGVLCRRCNLVLGQIQDDLDLLNSMANYLKATKSIR